MFTMVKGSVPNYAGAKSVTFIVLNNKTEMHFCSKIMNKQG